jgi:carbon-monoxide dehydrogenase medium subunit
VIPAQFDYVRAGSVAEAISLLGEHGEDAKLLAGGHSLLPLMKLRLATPSVLIDLGGIEGLSAITTDGEEVRIGALARHADLVDSDVLATEAPVLAAVAAQVGDRQVRHRGTIGGSLAHADPASDLPAAVLALGGTLVAQGPAGERTIAASDFFQGFLETALAPDELLTEIRVPRQRAAGWSFQKFTRRAQDWAIVGAVVARDGASGRAGIALVNMAATPVRAAATEAALAGGASVAEAAERADEGTEPSSDINASEAYRRHLARVLVRRGLEEAGA